MRRVLLCLLALALCPLTGDAQTYSYTQYRTAQGLPADKVNAVTRDRIGFLWVATDNGLARYDGRSFTTYQASLESRYIRDLVRRPDGDLLLANDAGIFAVTPRTDTATVRRLIGARPRPTDSTVVYPNGVYEDAQGRLWVSQPNGAVARWHDGRLRSFPFGEDHATGASDSDFAFAEDGQGRLWLAARTGQLYRYARDAERFERVRLPQPPTQVHDLRAQGDTLWVVGDRLVQAQIGAEGTLTNVRTHGTGGRRLTHMTAGPEGFLFGTRQSGLFRGTIERTGLQLREVFGGNDPHRIEELPFRAIHHVYVDRDGSIWLGSGQGLGLLQSRFFGGVAGMPSNNTLAVHPGDDRVLLSFGEVYSVRPGEERDFVARPLPVSREQFVASIASTGDRLWMGTADGLLMARTDGRVTQRIDLTDRGGGIFYMLGDHRGDLWVCQAPTNTPLKGVTRVRPDGTTKFYDADDGVENRILVLREGPRNALYAAGIGPTTYLFRYQPDRDRFINLSRPLLFDHSRGFEVHDLAIGERGLVWMATTDGLLRYDLERVQRVDLGPHTGTEIRSVETAPDGSIWLATDTDGLLHYREGTWVQFGQDTGLPTKVTVYRTLRTDARGRLWLGTAEGAVHSRRRRPTPASTPTPLLLDAQINGRDADGLDRFSLRTDDALSLRYATLAFPGDDLRYQYRLTGTPDSTWSAPTADNTLRLQNLSRGAHTLELRAKKGGGHHWSTALQVPVRVRPVWYRTWWAYGLFGLGGIGALAYAVRLGVRRQRRRIHELEDELAEREREIDAKERKLERQHRDLEDIEAELSSRREEVETTRTRLNVVHDVIEAIPPNASWSQVLHALADAAEHVDGIDAVEFGYHNDGEICYEGYDQRREAYTHRREDFDERTVLPVWSLVNDEPVRIGEYQREHTQYVHPGEDQRYPSMMCLPFHLPGRQHLVLVVYGRQTHAFDEQDRMMAQVLVDHLAVAVNTHLEPETRA